MIATRKDMGLLKNIWDDMWHCIGWKVVGKRQFNRDDENDEL
jgi:hypothetical protein